MVVPTDRKRLAVAIFAALVVMLRSFGIAAASEAVYTLDAFGNPLCISDEVSGDGHPDHNGKSSDCCALACSGWASSVLPPQDASVAAGAFGRISEPLAGWYSSPIRPALDDKQGNPRAPPVRV